MKKQFLLVIAIILMLSGCLSRKPGLIINGNFYTIKTYGETTWMTENLRVKVDANGQLIKFYFPNEDSSLVEKYGLLYNYKTALEVCPDGWHLPTNMDWDELIELHKGKPVDIFKDKTLWQANTNYEDNGFLMQPSGVGNTEFPNQFQQRAILWSQTKQDTHFVWSYGLQTGVDTFRIAPQHPSYAFSVRCVTKK